MLSKCQQKNGCTCYWKLLCIHNKFIYFIFYFLNSNHPHVLLLFLNIRGSFNNPMNYNIYTYTHAIRMHIIDDSLAGETLNSNKYKFYKNKIMIFLTFQIFFFSIFMLVYHTHYTLKKKTVNHSNE